MLRLGATTTQRLTQTLNEILDFLVFSGILRLGTPIGYGLVGDLPENFALDQSLAPSALDSLHSFHRFEEPDLRPSLNELGPGEEEHFPVPVLFSEVLDIISATEMMFDNPSTLLHAQGRSGKNRMPAELKAAGADYGQHRAALGKITYPRPLGDQPNATFEVYREENPWAKYFQPRAKSVLCDMIETRVTFSSYIALLTSAYAEEQLLRYLSDAWRTLNQITPEQLRVPHFLDVMEWLQQLIHEVDSSLLDGWKYLENPSLCRTPTVDTTITDAPELAFG